MKVEVKIQFHDISNFDKVYKVGEKVEFEDERAEHLAKLGLVEIEKVEKDTILDDDDEVGEVAKRGRKKKDE